MRPNVLTRTLISVTTVVGIAAGSLAGASASFAASASASKPAASSVAAVPFVVNNLGLSNARAQNVQTYLQTNWSYTGQIDGQLGTDSWKAFQRHLRFYDYTGAIDGIVGSGTIKALQRMLRDDGWGYTGAIDGLAGTGTRDAFARFADGVL
jgi:lysozyme family protein